MLDIYCAHFISTFDDTKTIFTPINNPKRRERSHSLVYSMLMYDLPIDMNALIQPEFLPHKYSWNHIVSGKQCVAALLLVILGI